MTGVYRRAAWGFFGLVGLALAILCVVAIVPMVWVWAVRDLSVKVFLAMFVSWVFAMFTASIMIAVASTKITKGVADQTKQNIIDIDSGPT